MLLLALSLATPTFAQSTEEDLGKYWALRDRLTSDFLIQGTARGESIPATVRTDFVSLLKWADGTVQLGWYIGVLATEHNLLSDGTTWPGYDEGNATALDDGLQELHDALFALERLDSEGELAFLWPCDNAGQLDGFFIRDDVPMSFSDQLAGIDLVLSDYADIALYNKEMSQDQVYHLLLGLALVKHLVPPGTMVDGRDLNAWAIELADRIVAHVVTVNNWQIWNPACNKLVDRGPDTRGYAGGLNKAIEFISGTTYLLPVLNGWSLMDSPLNPAYLNTDNLHMTMVLAAVGEGYGLDTLDVLMALAPLQEWYLYPLAYAAMHDATAHPDWAAIEGDLDAYAAFALGQLPAGDEPMSPRPFTAPHGWTSMNRYIRPLEDHYDGGTGTEGQSYHGLDYLLLHNLYYTVSPGLWGIDAPEDTGTTDTGTTVTAPTTDTATTEPGPDDPVEPSANNRAGEKGGCSCQTSSGAVGFWFLPLLVGELARRRGTRVLAR